MNKRAESAKIRAQTQGKVDPMFWINKGRSGGQVKGVKKGLGAVTPEKLKEIRAKGLETRRRNARNKV